MNHRRHYKRLVVNYSESDSETCEDAVCGFNSPSFSESEDASFALYNPTISRIISDSSESESAEFGPLNKNISRKRKNRPETHKKTISKKLRNSGKRYVNLRGHIVNEKSFSNTSCGCKNNCAEKITSDDRQAIFDSFWQMEDFRRQNAFICGIIQRKDILQRRPRKGRAILRSGSNKYFLKSNQGLSVAVCRKFFLDTFCISEGRVNRALKKVSDGREPGEDLRGNKGCPSRKISEDRENDVCQHILSFPSYQSHYTRNHNENRRYLSGSLNIRMMYTLYVEKCTKEDKTPVKEHYYRYIFNTKFNLHFYVPKKDTCKNCDIYKIKVSNPDISAQAKIQLENEHETHLQKAELARSCMKNDSEYAQNNPETYVCSMDLQKALPFPVITVSEAYYKRNLYCYNFGVHDLATDTATFYVWNETIASRGAQEISSCLIKHLKLQAQGKRTVIIYSDACTGQNRNIKLALALMSFLQSNETTIEKIEQKFLVSGHSFLPNDSDFGSVEVKAKGKVIYVPEQWYDIMRSARRKKKFGVCEMNSEEFFSTATLEKNITRRKMTQEKDPVNWLKMQWLCYEKYRPYEILFKESLQESMNFKILNIRPAGRKGRPVLLQNIPRELLYPRKRPVSELKKQDMIDLLPFIPPIHHAFFQNLVTIGVQEDNGPLPPFSEEMHSDGE